MKSASRLNNALLVIVRIIVSFLIAEAMLRLFSSGDYFVWQPNLRQIFRPSPGVMPGISGDSRFFINESGIRGRSFSRKDGYRILALGGITTECLYLDQSETWSHLLQEILNEEFEALPVWVGNVGKSGHSTSQHILQTEKLLDQYPTIDLVVLLIGVNDLLRRLILDEKYRPLSEEGLGYQERLRRAFAVYPSWDESSSFYERTEIRRTWRRIRQHFLKPTVEVPIAEVPIQDKFGDFFTKLRNHRKDATRIRDTLPDLTVALNEYTRNINTIIDIVQKRNAEIILLTQPSMWKDDLPEKLAELLWGGSIGAIFQLEKIKGYYAIDALADAIGMYNKATLRVCEERRIHCLDLASALPKDDSVFYDDVHFNESGARKTANILAQYLLESGLLDHLHASGD